MSSDRRQARVAAMQALCQWDVQRDESPDGLREFMSERKALGGVADRAVGLVEAFWAQRRRVDECLAAAVSNWDLSRISPVERNIMRVAMVEFLGGDVPPSVVIDEAIEIGREYGGRDSPRFINGVLDTTLKILGDVKHDRPRKGND